MKNPNKYIISSQLECNIFLQIIDLRISKFHNIIKNQYQHLNDKIFDDLDKYLIKLRLQLKSNFQELYNKEFLNKKIPVSCNSIVYSHLNNSINFNNNTKCCICDEKRSLNYAHIIPRSMKGPDEKWNYLILCANHHYLFDNNRLSKNEWDSIDWDSIDKRAREYAINIRLISHTRFWNSNE